MFGFKKAKPLHFSLEKLKKLSVNLAWLGPAL